MPPSRFRKAARAAAIAWTAAVFLLCLWPGEQLPETAVPFADKWTHFILFGVFSLLWLLSLLRPQGRVIILVILIAAGLGALIEGLQDALPALHRSADLYDALADALGGLLGALGYLAVPGLRSPADKKPERH